MMRDEFEKKSQEALKSKKKKKNKDQIKKKIQIEGHN
jgi:hypothetical protein